jgi:chromosomal replication initiation ATPase DnaA
MAKTKQSLDTNIRVVDYILEHVRELTPQHIIAFAQLLNVINASKITISQELIKNNLKEQNNWDEFVDPSLNIKMDEVTGIKRDDEVIDNVKIFKG